MISVSVGEYRNIGHYFDIKYLGYSQVVCAHVPGNVLCFGEGYYVISRVKKIIIVSFSGSSSSNLNPPHLLFFIENETITN